MEEERLRTAEALGERTDEFMKLKVEGINDCAEVLVAALMDDRERHIFGRRTMPEMDMASLSCAIQNLWLASRACLLYTSPSPRDGLLSRMPSSA